MNYYILILEEKVKSFSLVGHGEKCAVSLMLKGYANPLETLTEEIKSLGMLPGQQRRFATFSMWDLIRVISSCTLKRSLKQKWEQNLRLFLLIFKKSSMQGNKQNHL